jgi:phospholipid N-methyltransferase
MLKRTSFLQVALSDIKVGALAKSSQYLVERALEPLQGKTLKTVVEYGPGDGIMTRELLHHLPQDGRLIVIESNRDFAALLRAIRDPRLEVIHGDVQVVIPKLCRNGLRDVDCIIGSIPFSWLSTRERERVLTDSLQLLSKDGSFIFFHQYIPVVAWTMSKFFEKVRVSFVLRNMFPCFIVVAENDLG